MQLRLAALIGLLLFSGSAAQPVDSPIAVTPGLDARYELGARFQSEAAGIAFNGPAGCREIRRAGGDQLVQYVNEEKKWSLSVSRAALSQPMRMLTEPDPNDRTKMRAGMLDSTVLQMQSDAPGAEVLRQDFINVGDVEVGMIAMRATVGLETRLTQRALVRAHDRLYYSFTFITPAPREGSLEQDPEARKVVDLFSRVVDSIKVLDQSRLIEEQNQRLFRTRALFVNLTEERIRRAITGEMWLRLIRAGKDVGYTYVVEEVASDLPRRGDAGRAGGADGVRVGIRSRTFPEKGAQVDAETWWFVTFDRRNEVWSSIGIITAPDGTREDYGEFGSADREIKRTLDPQADAADPNDPRQPSVRQSEVYTLHVTRNTRQIRGDQIERQLPPFYLPQALGHLLPRLLPLNEPKTYLFAVWVSDSREVMKRYIDVDSESTVTLAGQKVRAVPIHDRIGVEGSVTTHYVSPDGKYLGSVNEDSQITVLASDKATLEKIWSNPNLTRPADVPGK